MELVLHTNCRCKERRVLREWYWCGGASRKETPLWRLAASGVGEAMGRDLALCIGSPIEAPHCCLKPEQRCLVERAEHHSGQDTINLIVNYTEGNRPTIPRASGCETNVIQCPTRSIELHPEVF